MRTQVLHLLSLHWHISNINSNLHIMLRLHFRHKHLQVANMIIGNHLDTHLKYRLNHGDQVRSRLDTKAMTRTDGMNADPCHRHQGLVPRSLIQDVRLQSFIQSVITRYSRPISRLLPELRTPTMVASILHPQLRRLSRLLQRIINLHICTLEYQRRRQLQGKHTKADLGHHGHITHHLRTTHILHSLRLLAVLPTVPRLRLQQRLLQMLQHAIGTAKMVCNQRDLGNMRAERIFGCKIIRRMARKTCARDLKSHIREEWIRPLQWLSKNGRDWIGGRAGIHLQLWHLLMANERKTCEKQTRLTGQALVRISQRRSALC